jgi:glycosyltransferase involved in cell wall biosynthesis
MVPSISVIVPVRERTADLLLSKLQNLGDGDFRDFEVIVVDNHSSVKMADHIVPGKYPFSVRCLRFDDTIPYNVPTDRNRGYALAKGVWLCFSDVDYSFSSKDLGVLFAKAQEHPSSWIKGMKGRIKDGGVRIDRRWKDAGACYFSLLPRNLFEEAGRFEEAFAGHYGHDDSLLTYRLNIIAPPVLVADVCAVCGRTDDGGVDGVVGTRDSSFNLELYKKLCKVPRDQWRKAAI